MKTYDYSISLLRIIACSMIVLTHICAYLNQPIIGEFFNVGVHIFFFISGFLYSGKKIQDGRSFIISRTIRIFIPLYLWILVNVVVLKRISLTPYKLVMTLLNLQGLHIISDIFPKVNAPWFLTIIYICYLLLIPFKKMESKYPDITKIKYLPLIFLLYVLLLFLNIDIFGITFFLFGYYIGKNNTMENDSLFKGFVIFVMSLLIRILTKLLLLNDILYVNIFVSLSTILLTYSIISIFRSICNKVKAINKALSSPFFRMVDSASIYVYLTHELFIDPCFRLLPNTLLAIIFVFVFSFSFSIILNECGKKIEKVFLHN